MQIPRHTLLSALLAVTISCACVFGTDVTGTASSSQLPFPTPLPNSDSKVSRPHQPQKSLINTTMFDTTYTAKSIFSCIQREPDTRQFFRWLEVAFERDETLQTIIMSHPTWTIFAPTNAAIDDFFKSTVVPATAAEDPEAAPKQLELPPLHFLLNHLVPGQLFVIFDSQPAKSIPLRTANQENDVRVNVCELDSMEECTKASAIYPSEPSTQHLHLLRSHILVRNRLAGNGVVHIVDRVIGSSDPNAPSYDTNDEQSPVSPLVDDVSIASPLAYTSPSTPRAKTHAPCPNCPKVKPHKVKSTPPPTVHDPKDIVKGLDESKQQQQHGGNSDGNHSGSNVPPRPVSESPSTPSEESVDSAEDDNNHASGVSLVSTHQSSSQSTVPTRIAQSQAADIAYTNNEPAGPATTSKNDQPTHWFLFAFATLFVLFLVFFAWQFYFGSNSARKCWNAVFCCCQRQLRVEEDAWSEDAVEGGHSHDSLISDSIHERSYQQAAAPGFKPPPDL